LQFSPDGRLLAAANARNVFLLELGQLKPVAVLKGHSKQVNDVAFTIDGRRLLTAGHDGVIRTWDVATKAAGLIYDWNIGPLTALTGASDGLTAAAAGSKGRVVIWDLE